MRLINNIVYSISNLEFKYPESNYSLKIDGNINIYKNDFVLINGNSGSGKSTFLYLLKGLIPNNIFGFYKGEIKYNSENILYGDFTVGLLQQNIFAQTITTNVMDELAFGLENLKISPSIIKNKIKILTKSLKLHYLLNRRIDTLSNGERQIINLVALIISEPAVLLLDEPTNYLDEKNCKLFFSIIKKISKNTTIIIIEHNYLYLKEMVNRYFFINDDGLLRETNHIQIEEQILPKENIQGSKNCILDVKDYTLANNKLISFKLNDGDILGIYGENAIGKSTLLSHIAKLQPSRLQIKFHDKLISQIPDLDYFKEIALLWQNPEYHFLFDYVESEVKDAELLKSFNLHNLCKQNPFSLSWGQKKRLALAIIFSDLKKLYLLDEPTIGQDYNSKQLVIKEIINRQKQGSAFIIVSHEFNLLNAICNTILKI